MLCPPAPYCLRAMQTADLPAVYAIDQLSFPTPARPGTYEHELTQTNVPVSYQVLLAAGVLIGYAGFWLQGGDEAHVVTIATHPQWRRRGLGELLLLNLLYLARAAGAALATLEVRRSNRAAQALYEKYGFALAGERRRYYRDTNEDALIYTAVLDEAYFTHFLPPLRRALWQQLGGDSEEMVSPA